MLDVISDLSTLTTIQEKSLRKLVDKSIFIICHDVQESVASEEGITTVDIGIGKISIKPDVDGIHYRFTPSTSLDNALHETVSTGKNPLVYELEQSLVKKIQNARKELF